MAKISILGCGWLGFPLAKSLLNKGFPVKGSTTSEGKISVLENSGIQPFLISLDSNGISGDIYSFLNESEILVIDIPPKLRGNSKEDFVGKIKVLIPFIEKSTVEKVLFVSSTSVYGDNNDLVTEETPLNPDSEGGKQLAIVENLLQNNTHFKTTVLRFGGLIGEDRHPVKFLSGRENLDNPEAPINLIHQKDCIGIIQKIIELNAWGKTFNAVAPFHPSREVYYTQKALELNLAVPKFSHEKTSSRKTISGNLLTEMLDYTFTTPHL